MVKLPKVLVNGGKYRGFAYIELILMLVVIAILMGWYFQRGGGGAHQEAASQYQHSMDRGNATACIANRTTMRTQIITMSMQNPGQPITRESLMQAGVNLNLCPEGGQINVSPDGSMSCSIHQP